MNTFETRMRTQDLLGGKFVELAHHHAPLRMALERIVGGESPVAALADACCLLAEGKEASETLALRAMMRFPVPPLNMGDVYTPPNDDD